MLHRQADYAPGNEIRPALNDVIPANPNQPYDMREVIQHVVDHDYVL